MTRSQNRVWPARPSSMLAPIEVAESSSFMLRRLITGPRSCKRIHSFDLACIGLYGLIGYQVVQRRNEIGIRMALGAGRMHVLWTMLRRALVWTTAGVTLGIPLALVASGTAERLLFGLSPMDVVTLSAAAASAGRHAPLPTGPEGDDGAGSRLNLHASGVSFSAFSSHCLPRIEVRWPFSTASALPLLPLRNRQDDGIVRRREMPVVEDRLSLLEAKMEQVGATLASMEATLLNLDRKVDRLDLRVDKLDMRLERQFLWVVGIQMTTLIAIIAGLFGLVAKLM